MNFKSIEIKDKKLIESYLENSTYRGCEYSFMNLALWGKFFGTEYTIVDDIIVFRSGEEDKKVYYYPVSDDNKKSMEVLQKLIETVKKEGEVFRIHSVSPKTKAFIEAECPKKYCFVLDRDSADYIYNREDLMTLKGKKYHGKRNHINRFLNNGKEWNFEFINKDNMAECIAMNQEWFKQNKGKDDTVDPDMLKEQEVLRQAFENFEELGLVGGLIRLEGKVVAFTMGEPLTEDTFVVHFEKAFSDVEGAYPLINREFVTNACEGYQFINREEDMGVEGLRKAKLSYYPEILLEKYYMTEDCSEVEEV